MSHSPRLYLKPLAVQPPSLGLTLSGDFPGYSADEAYQGRISILNSVGKCKVEVISHETLPTGWTIYVDNVTKEVVLNWPASQSLPSEEHPVQNGSFESGMAGWEVQGPGWSVIPRGSAPDGSNVAQYAEHTGESRLKGAVVPAVPGTFINLGCEIEQGASSKFNAGGRVELVFVDSDGVETVEEGNVVDDGSGGAWNESRLYRQVPAGTEYVYPQLWGFRKRQNLPVYFDSVSWDHSYIEGTEDEDPIALHIRVTDATNATADWQGIISPGVTTLVPLQRAGFASVAIGSTTSGQVSTITRQADWLDDDYALITLSLSSATAPAAPVGMALLSATTVGSAATHRIYIYGGLVGTQTSWSFAWSPSGLSVAALMTAYSNLDPLDPVVVSATQASANYSGFRDVWAGIMQTSGVRSMVYNAGMLVSGSTGVFTGSRPFLDGDNARRAIANGVSRAVTVSAYMQPVDTDQACSARFFISGGVGGGTSLALRIKSGTRTAPTVVMSDLNAALDAAAPGSVWMLTYRGDVVQQREHGVIDLVNNQPFLVSTRFPIHSVSKVFTELAARKLVQDGMLDLSLTAKSYLGASISFGANGDSATVNDFLTMVSGGRINTYIYDDPHPAATNAWASNAFTAVGEHYAYDNGNYGVLQRVIESILGVDGAGFNAWMQENIFSPVGMFDVGTVRTSADAGNTGYTSGAGANPGTLPPPCPCASIGGWVMPLTTLSQMPLAYRSNVVLNQTSRRIFSGANAMAQHIVGLSRRGTVVFKDGGVRLGTIFGGSAFTILWASFDDGFDFVCAYNGDNTTAIQNEMTRIIR